MGKALGGKTQQGEDWEQLGYLGVLRTPRVPDTTCSRMGFAPVIRTDLPKPDKGWRKMMDKGMGERGGCPGASGRGIKPHHRSQEPLPSNNTAKRVQGETPETRTRIRKYGRARRNVLPPQPLPSDETH